MSENLIALQSNFWIGRYIKWNEKKNSYLIKTNILQYLYISIDSSIAKLYEMDKQKPPDTFIYDISPVWPFSNDTPIETRPPHGIMHGCLSQPDTANFEILNADPEI